MKRINIFLNGKGKEKKVISSNERKMLLTLGFHISRPHFGNHCERNMHCSRKLTFLSPLKESPQKILLMLGTFTMGFSCHSGY